MKEIYLAGGCFWGVQAYYQKIKGIINTEVGYLNGGFTGASYGEVCASSGHVEVVKITFDEKIININDIFLLFLRIIDPFSLNRQGNDFGIQYRSGIYSKNNVLLKKIKNKLNEWEAKNGKSKMEILSVNDYTPAEEVHQDYLLKNAGGYCHINLNNIPKKYLK